jgi:hypothetical protein
MYNLLPGSFPAEHGGFGQVKHLQEQVNHAGQVQAGRTVQPGWTVILLGNYCI